MVTPGFRQLFTNLCQMDTIPDVTLGQMKSVKADFMERILTSEALDSLGNAARLLASWLDGALEYTVLKHEVIVL